MTKNDQNETQNYELQLRFLIINVSLYDITYIETFEPDLRQGSAPKISCYDVFTKIHENVILIKNDNFSFFSKSYDFRSKTDFH